ncbi:MAG: bifunctional phosphoribosyl-AMP cyclohydrolase/phosphoribosyl-ATP diphosphatase HisIE [Clostridiales bacterium]|nr:bifunctional phosphoribosyl-AMP cyclohydrolase/phosphoribosyl-ATP diphosphatase HisIE [Clostridiales bacterium]
MRIKKIDLSKEVLVKEYLDAGWIIAEDSSTSDQDHEKCISHLRYLAKEIPVPFFVQGNLKKLEDVKKYLYAGAKRVILRPDQKELQEEVTARFGKGKAIMDLAEISVPQPAFSWKDMKLNSDGMVPVVVQDYRTNQVLMVAYMNQESYEYTLKTGRMTYYSRSRQELWEKGATSGHYQYVKSLSLDCDNDTILAKVAQLGAACHTGSYSCFYRDILPEEYPETNPYDVLEHEYDIIMNRKNHPREGSYTNYLFDKGLDKILKKVGEESAELIIAAKNSDREEVIYELSDFLYHAMVLMAEKGITWKEIAEEMARRG